MRKRTIGAVLAACLLAATLVGCQGKSDQPASTEMNTNDKTQAVVESKTSPLTGKEIAEDQVGKRPVSFIVNNDHHAWPQRGLGAAEVVYQWPYEGESTRIMAVLPDALNAEAVGPLRSARHDFVEMSIPLNTIFVHWGGSKPGYAAVKKVDHVDGMSSAAPFYRDQERLNNGVDLEHTGFVNTKRLMKYVEEKKIKTTTDIQPIYNFAKSEVVLDDEAGKQMSIQLSGTTKVTVKYDADAKNYTIYENGEQRIDANTSKPVTTDNVLLLFGKITSYDGVNVWRDLKLEDGGNGYYITRGTKQAIKWVKKTKNDGFKFTDAETDQEIEVNPGTSWVYIAEKGTKAKFQ